MKLRRSYVWAASLMLCSLALLALYRFRSGGSVSRSTASTPSAGEGSDPFFGRSGAVPPRRNPDGSENVVLNSVPTAVTPEQATALDGASREKVAQNRIAFQKRINTWMKAKRLITLKQRTGEYRVVPYVYALPEERLNAIADYELVDKRTRDVLVRLGPNAEVPTGAQSVVFSPMRNTLGSITGNLTVVLREGANADALAQTFRLELIQAFPQQNLAFFRAPSQRVEELIPIAQKLSKDPSVASAELEVRERVYVPH